EFARIPVEVEYASEFRYRNPPIDRNTIVVALTQSGETADTLAALRESKRKGHPTLSLCNVVGSSIAREADGGVYLHAGPEIGLVEPQTPSVFLMPRGPIFDKVMSNLEEVKARGGPVIAIACEGDEDVAARADEIIYVPEVPEYLQPIVSVVPLQLLAYHIAVLRGCDVDKPRNLAKSVTVE